MYSKFTAWRLIPIGGGARQLANLPTSAARPADESRDLDFMHRRAHEVLPALLQALNADTRRDPRWLLGHSDGASIALLYAARYPQQISAAILLPRIFCSKGSVFIVSSWRVRPILKEISTTSWRSITTILTRPSGAGTISGSLTRFANGRFEDEIETICRALLAVQGVADEYGTLRQVRGIAQRLQQTVVVEMIECRHSPHRDQPERLIV